MSLVTITSIELLSPNPSPFNTPYHFKIKFECLAPLPDDLEWKLVYVGSAKDPKLDQELDSALVGPVPVGVNSFEFKTDPPNASSIPSEDLLGVTVLLVTCSYKDQEFVRVGYYVNTEYDNEELKGIVADPEKPNPDPPVIERLQREVLVAKPRVTRVNIRWDINAGVPLATPAPALPTPTSNPSAFQPVPTDIAGSVADMMKE